MALAIKQDFDFVENDAVVAEYNQTRALIGGGGGINIGRDDDVRLLLTIGTLTAGVSVGDPGLPELDGRETRSALRWTHDGQDSAIVPSRGVRTLGEFRHIFDSPAVPRVTDRSSAADQVEVGGSAFRRRGRSGCDRGAGTSLTASRSRASSFSRPAAAARRAGVWRISRRDYALVTGGYLKGVGRLPDFLGGPVFLGGWIENGSAFDALDKAELRTNVSLGTVIDTLIGPAILGASFGFNGDWRYYFGIGRVF